MTGGEQEKKTGRWRHWGHGWLGGAGAGWGGVRGLWVDVGGDHSRGRGGGGCGPGEGKGDDSWVKRGGCGYS